MNSVTPECAEAIRRRQQSTTEIRDSLRELRIQLALLNYRVGSQLGLKDVDLDCLDILDSHGPLSPTAIAQRAGAPPADEPGDPRPPREGRLGRPRTRPTRPPRRTRASGPGPLRRAP